MLRPLTVSVEASVPEFIYPIDNITVAAGRDAQFTCVVNNLEGHKVGYYKPRVSLATTVTTDCIPSALALMSFKF